MLVCDKVYTPINVQQKPGNVRYIGGGAEGFMMYKLQRPGDSLSSSLIVTRHYS
jgi:hypothetical protein